VTEAIPIPGAEVYYDERFLVPEEATQFFDVLFSKCRNALHIFTARV